MAPGFVLTKEGPPNREALLSLKELLVAVTAGLHNDAAAAAMVVHVIAMAALDHHLGSFAAVISPATMQTAVVVTVHYDDLAMTAVPAVMMAAIASLDDDLLICRSRRREGQGEAEGSESSDSQNELAHCCLLKVLPDLQCDLQTTVPNLFLNGCSELCIRGEGPADKK
jgi:hypothetical protein